MLALYISASLLAVLFAAIDCPIAALIATVVFVGVWAVRFYQKHLAPKPHYHARRVL